MVLKRSKPYHHGDLRSAIIDAALQLVRDKGPRGFTLNEASRSAGVSKSAPYKHFRDKDALLIEVAILGTHTMRAELTAAANTQTTAQGRLLSIALAYIRFARERPDFFAVMFQSGIDKSQSPELEHAVAAAFNVAVEAAADFEHTPEAVDRLALAVWTMAHGFAMLIAEDAFARAGRSGISDETARDLIKHYLLEADETVSVERTDTQNR